MVLFSLLSVFLDALVVGLCVVVISICVILAIRGIKICNTHYQGDIPSYIVVVAIPTLIIYTVILLLLAYLSY